MARQMTGLLDQLRQKMAMKRWQSAVQNADTLDHSSLRSVRSQARQMRQVLDRLLHLTEGRMTRPLAGADAIQKPLHCDWAYRPELWRGPLSRASKSSVASKTDIGSEATVFHDSSLSEITVRQLRNANESDLAPYGVKLDVLGFDGSFLSLVIGLPQSAVDGLKRNHLVRLTIAAESEAPVKMFARMNVQHGPNTEQLVRALPLDDKETIVEFDLAYTNLSEKRVDRMWVDIVVENPEMNQVILRDVTFSRRPRAEV